MSRLENWRVYLFYIFKRRVGIGRTIMAQAFYVRNPYPVPDISREGAWISRGPVLGDKVSPSDRDWNVKLSAHERLFAHHTLNSIRRDRRLVRPQVWYSMLKVKLCVTSQLSSICMPLLLQVPHDALDLALNSVYAHSRDTLVSKMYVPIQPETLGRETWRVLRNEIKVLRTKCINASFDNIKL